MRNSIKTLAGGAVALLFVFGCTKDAGNAASPSTQTPSTTGFKVPVGPRASLGQSAFNLWTTCGTAPYDISGTNGICVPVGDCGSSIDAGQESTGQDATGFQFYGCFKGGTSATSYAEEAVFLCDNDTQWNGDEMGFVKTLEDNTLKAYVQGGGNYYTTVISTGDNGYHTFKAQCRSSSNVDMVDFYVDGTYTCTLTNTAGHYWENYDYFVGTNHWAGGSNPVGQQIEMYNMTTY
jgi:hypothetical protein